MDTDRTFIAITISALLGLFQWTVSWVNDRLRKDMQNTWFLLSPSIQITHTPCVCYLNSGSPALWLHASFNSNRLHQDFSTPKRKQNAHAKNLKMCFPVSALISVFSFCWCSMTHSFFWASIYSDRPSSNATVFQTGQNCCGFPTPHAETIVLFNLCTVLVPVGPFSLFSAAASSPSHCKSASIWSCSATE